LSQATSTHTHVKENHKIIIFSLPRDDVREDDIHNNMFQHTIKRKEKNIYIRLCHAWSQNGILR